MQEDQDGQLPNILNKVVLEMPFRNRHPPARETLRGAQTTELAAYDAAGTTPYAGSGLPLNCHSAASFSRR